MARPVTAFNSPKSDTVLRAPGYLGRAKNRRCIGHLGASVMVQRQRCARRRPADASRIKRIHVLRVVAEVACVIRESNTCAPSMKKGRFSGKNVSKAERLSTAGSTSTCPKSGFNVASSVRADVSRSLRSSPARTDGRPCV